MASLLTLGDLTAASASSARVQRELEAKSRLRKKKERGDDVEMAVAVPPSRTSEKRAARAEAYASAVSAADEWEPLVRREARLEELSFGKREKGGPTFDAEAQRAELAAARSALFAAGQKNKYHAKVKSKQYARGRKKRLKERRRGATEAAAEADPEAKKALEDEQALARVRERVTLKHASTSAWAKSLKKRGRAALEATKDARAEHVELGQELRRKQDDVEELPLAPPVTDEVDEANEVGQAIPSRVASMRFMQRAAELKTQRAKEDAQELLNELEEDDDLDDIKKLAAAPSFAASRLSGFELKKDWLEAAERARDAHVSQLTKSRGALVIEPQREEEEAPKKKKKKEKRKAADLSQEELVDLAFDDEVDEEFAAEKRQVEEGEDPKKKHDDDDELPGWGSWTGEGTAPPPKKRRRTNETTKKTNAPKSSSPHVILNPKPIKQRAKLKVAQVPYPFTSRAQYEKYLAAPIGPEWNAKRAVQELIKPPVIVRPGVAIDPIRRVKE